MLYTEHKNKEADHAVGMFWKFEYLETRFLWDPSWQQMTYLGKEKASKSSEPVYGLQIWNSDHSFWIVASYTKKKFLTETTSWMDENLPVATCCMIIEE